MQTIHLEPNDQTARQITRAAFPSYNGKTFQVRIVEADHKFSLVSGWSGGSRDYWSVVKLDEMRAVDVSGMVGDHWSRDARATTLPEGYALVKHCIFSGKDLGITIHLQQANAAALLPAPVELTATERLVLVAIRTLKPSYGGIPNLRQHESGLDLATWTSTADALKTRGFIAKNNAITPAGRNAIGSERMDLMDARKAAGLRPY